MKGYLLRIGGVLVALTLVSMPAQATPIQIGEGFVLAFQAETCFTCGINPIHLPNVTMQGYLTVVPAAGAFQDTVFRDLYYASAWMVTGMGGTVSIDCTITWWCTEVATYSLSFPYEPSEESYLLFGAPTQVNFAMDGTPVNIFNDHARNLFSWQPHAGMYVPLGWRTVVAPEPSSLSLLALGLVGLRLLKSRQQ